MLLRRFRVPAIGVTLHGAGGECAATGWATPAQESIVAWGGVLAQLALFALITLLAELGVWPEHEIGRELYNVLAVLNLVLVLLNLLPVGRLARRRAHVAPALVRLPRTEARLLRAQSRKAREEEARVAPQKPSLIRSGTARLVSIHAGRGSNPGKSSASRVEAMARRHATL